MIVYESDVLPNVPVFNRPVTPRYEYRPCSAETDTTEVWTVNTSHLSLCGLPNPVEKVKKSEDVNVPIDEKDIRTGNSNINSNF